MRMWTEEGGGDVSAPVARPQQWTGRDGLGGQVGLSRGCRDFCSVLSSEPGDCQWLRLVFPTEV